VVRYINHPSPRLATCKILSQSDNPSLRYRLPNFVDFAAGVTHKKYTVNDIWLQKDKYKFRWSENLLVTTIKHSVSNTSITIQFCSLCHTRFNYAFALQKALSPLVAWADEWQLSISIDKCCVLHIGKVTVTRQFHIKNIPLTVVSSYCNLGITITKDLSPTTYINEIVAKAHQRANMIHRCFVSQNVELLTRAFITYVRPLLEYNSVVWSRSLKHDIALTEQVQTHFTKRLPGLKNHPYDVRLKLLN